MRGRSHPLLRGRTSTRHKAWYERSDGAARLAHDRALVCASYPTLSQRIDEEARRVHLEGTLVFRAECGIPTEVEVRVDFPLDYPSREPRAYDSAARFPHTMDRHFSTEDGCCCLWLPPKSLWDPFSRDALLPFLDEVVVFFDRQLVYDACGQVEWPGGQYGHGAAGYRAWVLEEFGGSADAVAACVPVFDGTLDVGRNDRCPCGIGRKFKHCHGPAVERVRSEIDSAMLTNLFRS